MTHRSPRVPPSLIHFPLRNVTLPFTISRPIASRQGVGGKCQRVRNRGLGYRLFNYTFFWSLPKRQQLRLSPSKQRAPSPSGSAASIRRSPPRSPGPLSSQKPRTTPSVIPPPPRGGTQGDSALISSSEAPLPATHRSLRSWAKVKDAGALPGAASTLLELSKCAGCCWTVGAAAANCHLLLQCLRGDVLLGRFSFLSVLKADVSVGKMLGKMKT